MTTLIENIGRLVQVEREIRPFVAGDAMSILPEIENAYLLVEDDVIKAFGPMSPYVLPAHSASIRSLAPGVVTPARPAAADADPHRPPLVEGSYLPPCPKCLKEAARFHHNPY